MDFRKRLQLELRKVDGQISMYDLAKNLKMRIDPMLEQILDIQQEYKQVYKNNVKNMVMANADFLNEFFKQDIIDLGFLIQHKIKEIAEQLQKKHNTMGHRMFYDSWILHRGY